MLYFKSFKNAFPAYDLVQIEDVLDKDPDFIIFIHRYGNKILLTATKKKELHSILSPLSKKNRNLHYYDNCYYC